MNDNKSLAESFAITKENVAAMLAIIGKEEANATSPTALVMLSNLKGNLKLLFDKMCTKELNLAMVRLGKSYQLDNNFFEIVSVPKTQGVTKLRALASAFNSLQQTHAAKHLHIVESSENADQFEFLIEVRDY